MDRLISVVEYKIKNNKLNSEALPTVISTHNTPSLSRGCRSYDPMPSNILRGEDGNNNK
jgi:hypothetical protein